MKVKILIFLCGLALYSCKKEARITEENTIDSQTSDSVTIKSPEDPNAFRVETISDQAEPGKVIFTENGKTIVSFDTQDHSGKIKLNGTEYPLDNLVFSENNYEITGKTVKIIAENGNFRDMVSDCSYGSFPEITILFNHQQVKLSDIKVQDCPNYN